MLLYVAYSLSCFLGPNLRAIIITCFETDCACVCVLERGFLFGHGFESHSELGCVPAFLAYFPLEKEMDAYEITMLDCLSVGPLPVTLEPIGRF
jgi:hypothetical protein